MSVCAVILARDEEDIIATTVGWLLRQVDHVVLLDHGSVDDTAAIARDLGCEVRDAPGLGYRQAERMNEAAARAREDGFEWIVPVDADEIWVPCAGGTISEALSLDVDVAQGFVYDHHPTGFDASKGDVTMRQRWRQPSIRWLKVAARTRLQPRFTNGNHGVFVDDEMVYGGTLFTIHHFPYRSIEQITRSARNAAVTYAADTTMPLTDSSHKRFLTRLSDRDIQSWWSKYAFVLDPEAAGFVLDPIPDRRIA